MDMKRAVKTVLGKYDLFFGGRASRSEFWWFVLFAVVTNVVLGMPADAGLRIGGTWPLVIAFVLSFVQGLWNLFLLLPGLAVTVRRLHDTDRRGWWLVPPWFLVLFGLAAVNLLAPPTRPDGMDVGPTLQGGSLIAAIVALAGFVMLVVLVVWLATRGTDGANRFGPDPMARAQRPTA